MAELQRNIEILFTGKDQLSSSLGSMGGKMNVFLAGVDAAAQTMAEVGEGVLKLDAALATLVAGGLAVAYKKASDFEASVVELEKVLGDQPGALEAASAAAMDLSDAYGVSANEALASTANFKQAGFGIQEAMELTKSALDLSIAGNLDAAQASELLIASLKGFQAPASEATRLIDGLNAVSNEYATDVEQLARGFAGISPVAREMGLSFEETMGFLTPVIEVFRSGDEAAVAMKTGLLKLLSPTKNVQDALASLGIEQLAANGQLRSGRDILFDVADAFGDASESTKLLVAQELFGVEQTARLVTAFDNLEKVQAVTQTALKGTGSAAEEVSKRLKTSQVQVERFKESFNNLAIAVGKEFLATQTDVIRASTAINLALREAAQGDAFDPLFDALNTFNKEVSEQLEQIAENLPEALEFIDWSPILDGLSEFRQEVSGLFEGIDLSTPQGLADALQVVADGIGSLLRVTSGMVEGFNPFFQAIREGIDFLLNMNDEQKKMIGDIAALAMAYVSNGGKVLAVLAGLNEAGVNLHRVFKAALEGITLAWNSLQVAFDAGVYHAAQALSGLLEVVNKATFGAFEDEKRRVDEFANAVGTSLVQNMAEAGGALEGLYDAITGVGEGADETKDRIGEMGASLNKIPEDKKIDFKANSFTRFVEELDKAGVSLENLPVDKAIDLYLNNNPFDEGMRFIQGKLDELDQKEAQIKVALNEAQTKEEIQQLQKALDDVANEREAYIKPLADKLGLKDVQEALEEAAPDKKETEVGAKTGSSVKKAGEELEEAAPDKKTVEIEVEAMTKVEIARLEADAKTIQTAMEWQAKLDISDIEAKTERLTTFSDNIAAMFENTGEVMESAFDALGDLPSYWNGGREILEYTEREMRLREQLTAEQRELIRSQMAYLDEVTKRIGDGQAEIKIDVTGLEPHLQAIFRAVMKDAQIQSVLSGELPMLLT